MKGPSRKAKVAAAAVARSDGSPPALTPRQAELLRFCVEGGYYRIPRRLTLRQLSAQLGISATSLSLALRRAEAKVMCHHVETLAAPLVVLLPRRSRPPNRTTR